jgi:vacuolar-type H+-ATPase subunit I/STV1
MAKLYELSNAYQLLQDTDELTEEEITTALDNVKEMFDVKASNLAKVILSIQSDMKAYDDEIARLTERKRIAQNKIKHLKDYLLFNMEATNTDKIKVDTVNISLRTSPPSVDVVNEEEIPENYWRVVKSVDKKAILEVYKDKGIIPPGINIITDKKYVSIK